MSWPPIEALVPHRGPALWLDQIVAHEGDTTRCRVRLAPSHPLAEDGRLPGVCAMEFIAQAAAAHSALRGRAGGRAEPGVLAGVSGFAVDTPWFEPSSELAVEVRQLAGGDGATASFEGVVWDGPREVGRGRVTVVRGVVEPRRQV